MGGLFKTKVKDLSSMKRPILFILTVNIALFFGCAKSDEINVNAATDQIPINEIQTIGSHNSYRIKTYQPIYDLLVFVKALLPKEYNIDELDYTHVPLKNQLSDYGMRSIELDIYNDPDGRFYFRRGNSLVQESDSSYIGALAQPGFKIIHIPDIDYQTHHVTFIDALRTLQEWSMLHPTHLPIYILVELKEESLYPTFPSFTKVAPFDEQAMNKIDEEIESVFAASIGKVLTPDIVRNGKSNLMDVVQTRQWPALNKARGKFCFILNTKKAYAELYKKGRPNLEGRKCFIFADASNPVEPFILQDDPTDIAVIKNLVDKGFMVRTRCDAGTMEARTGDIKRMNNAIQSGAQILSTDYYKPDPRADSSVAWTKYKVSFDNGAVAKTARKVLIDNNQWE
jgi:hypothetical protein